jgi:hypothetical protein
MDRRHASVPRGTFGQGTLTRGGPQEQAGAAGDGAASDRYRILSVFLGDFTRDLCDTLGALDSARE